MKRGSAVGIGIAFEGEMPGDTDVLVIAWNNTEQRLMNDFNHVVRDEPWLIRASELNKLPVGEYELQLQPRQDGRVVDKVVMPLRVVAARPAVVTKPRVEQPVPSEPQTPKETAGVQTDANDTNPSPPVLTLVPRQSPQDTPAKPAAERPLSDADAESRGGSGLAWSFSADTPTVYERNSGTPIKLDVKGKLPDEADILIIAWSHTDKRLIPGVVHKVLEQPFRLDQSKLDALPSGRIELQALYRNGSSTVLKKHNFVVVGPGESPEDFAEELDDLADASRPTSSTPAADQPRSTDGFTVFNRSKDTQVIYVSSSIGNDDNDGSTPALAVASIERGYDLLRDGKPDWLLFKSGDTWDTGFPGWKKSGRSATEKILVGTYGSGDRPYFRVSDSHFIGSYGQVSHVAFVGLHAHAVIRDPGDKDFQPNVYDRSKAANNMGGFVWLAEGGDILLEDCHVDFFRFNLVFQRDSEDTMLDGITLRRNIITNAYGHHDAELGGHSSGLFAKRVKNLYIEENVFDHNGWNPVVEGADRTKFNHNLYIQYDCSKVTAVGNVISRGSAHGAQFRPGATVTNNLFVRNPSAFFVAQEESRVTRNVVLMSDDMNSEHVLGFGIDVLPTSLAVIENNIISQKKGTHAGAPAINVSWEERSMDAIDSFEVCIRDNKICDWPVNDGERSSILIGTDAANVFDQSGNQIDSASGGDTSPPWVDPYRNVETYMKSLGKPGTLDEFIACAVERPRGVWVPAWSADAVNHYIRRGFDVELAD